MWFLLAFIAVPLIEIGLFIQVGGLIGLWPTLVIVVITALVGTTMLRGQGLAALAEVQGSMQNFSNPAEPLAHGALIIFAGALLLTPGFFTDGVGFALLIPLIRLAIIRYIKTRITVNYADETPDVRQQPSNPQTIDGEFSEVSPPNPDSKWSKD